MPDRLDVYHTSWPVLHWNGPDEWQTMTCVLYALPAGVQARGALQGATNGEEAMVRGTILAGRTLTQAEALAAFPAHADAISERYVR